MARNDESTNQPSPVHPSAAPLFALAPTIWDRVCVVLEMRLGADNFQRCFSGTSARLTDDGRFVITVPNPIHQLWIESNHSGPVADAVAEVTGAPAVIEFHVATEPAPAAFAPLPELKAARVNAPVQEPIRYFSDAGLNAKFNFDSFVAGPNSSYSLAVARAVAEKPGRIYNPLFFHGPTGLGKTHLMQAIGQEVLARKPRALVRYVTSEQFTNEFVDSIKKQTFSQFRQKYRKVDVLLIDDVHFFEGKDSTQEEFFHTFNELFNNAKQIVLASDRPPSEIKNLESRLVSRFEWGLATQIQVPDFETRIAILRRKQNDFNVSLDSWILDFMAQRIRANVRKLEGALMRVAAHVSLEGAVTTESALATLLHDVIDEDVSKTVTVDRVQRIVATHYDLRVSDLTGPRRPKNIAEARQVAMFLTRTLTKLPLVQIGDEFGGRDHGTVIHACKVITNLVNGSTDFKRTLDNLAGKICES
ncbi:MAG: chromosomal replication initiator protein DnaA [Prosthecobacter sp.]|jgi:chromosomal replication initiator protein|uniref:chromosomal replication initiator protein DnaA n=1 Tax=Prosthecobacter sp. TaxID=1965333 RepID=UPI0019F5B37A|nr:chromosomal replication initiator protein DnaA [Prosthecobacter sp.]MBE2282348.1 chromosomal replication initiator protein DnaA [Prosthecobacter sp.]